jgi:peptide subunit release factor RF-3
LAWRSEAPSGRINQPSTLAACGRFTRRVGDTLTEGEVLQFEGIPNFAPELRRVVLEDAMRAKQLNRALDDMAEEDVAQVFRPIFGSWPIGGMKRAKAKRP